MDLLHITKKNCIFAALMANRLFWFIATNGYWYTEIDLQWAAIIVRGGVVYTTLGAKLR
jgi:hypothetical protein